MLYMLVYSIIIHDIIFILWGNMLPKMHTKPLFMAIRKDTQSSLISFYKKKSFRWRENSKGCPKVEELAYKS